MATDSERRCFSQVRVKKSYVEKAEATEVASLQAASKSLSVVLPVTNGILERGADNFRQSHVWQHAICQGFPLNSPEQP